MARVKKTYRRKRKTSWYNKKYSTLQLAKKAWYATKYLKGIINSERMYADNDISMSGVKSNSYSLQRIAVGDQTGSRTGNSILVRSLYIRGYININPSVTLSTRISIALVQDKQQIGDTIPLSTDIFTSTDPEAQIKVGATNNVGGRFKIIWRKNYTLIPGQRPTVELDKYWKLYSHVKFNGNNTTDVQKNGYYLVVLTSESTNYVTMVGNARLGYYDN